MLMYQNSGKSGHIKVKKKQEDYETKRKEKKKFGHIIAAMDHFQGTDQTENTIFYWIHCITVSNNNTGLNIAEQLVGYI